MPTYTYKARNPAGQSVKGTMEADSCSELAEKLHKMGYLTTQVVETRPGIHLGSVFESFGRIPTEDWVMFNTQLSNLLNAGIPLLSSLNTVSQEMENQKLRNTLASVSRSVEAGESFSEALTHYPHIFPKLLVSVVKAGEASGKLDTLLTRYATYCEEQQELRQKIMGALFYPIVLLLAGIGVTLFIVTFIIPQFAEIFLKVGISLPLPTRILYWLGMVLKQYWLLGIVFLFLGGVGLRLYARTPAGRFQLDRLCLSIPVFGSLARKVAISRFARTLGMLLASGVPILHSLEIVRETMGNEVLARVIDHVGVAVERGEKISEPLADSREFPLDTVQMISVGEEAGSLDEMFSKVSDFYDRSVGYTVKKVTTLIEPLLLVMMGGLIGFIMASLLLPMFDMMKILREARTGGF